MTRRLRVKHQLSVRRDTVMEALRVIDPEGVSIRKRHRLKRRKYSVPGPNFLWHIDGWDKLKPYGFCVHGCIDGFSRRLLWLEVRSTNKNPTVVVQFFLDTVSQLGGVPRMLRMDKGTENGLIADMQTLLRLLNGGAVDETCVIQGKSSANQRIEAYWSQLKKGGGGWWRDFFRDLRDSGAFLDHDPLHIECIRFCFMPLLRTELHSVAEMWNVKDIHVPKKSELRGGKPDVMFFMPEAYATRSHILKVPAEDIEICKEMYGEQAQDCSAEFVELVNLMFPDLQVPNNTNEALAQFIRITNTLLYVE